MNYFIFCTICVHFFVISILCQSIQDDKFIGCYNDGDARAMSIKTVNDQLSVSTCLDLCRTYKYTFAGLENGNECHCGEDFAKYGVVEGGGGCAVQCSGSGSSDICGGENQLSVYSTCHRGFYGTSCNQKCPHTCSLSGTKICHLKTGKCCGDGTDSSNSFYCNFFDKGDCGSVDGDPRPEVDNMVTNAGKNLNFFTTLTFPVDAVVTAVVYYTREFGYTEYVSFWRNVDNDKYMMVAKLELKPNATGKQSKMLNHNEKAFVQAGDAVAVHYPDSNPNYHMIPYQKTTTPDITASDLHPFFNTQDTGDDWEAGYTRLFTTLNSGERTAAIKVKYACIKDCASGKFGGDCSGTCMNCNDNNNCHFVDGTCPNGCKPGYKSYNCANPCDTGSFGQNCSSNCGEHCLNGDCHNVNGICRGCEAGYQGDFCETECDTGSYGLECNNTCGNCLNDTNCHHIDGSCDQGCNPGYKGSTCHDMCNPGSYGLKCQGTCGSCKADDVCDHIDGQCKNGCGNGFQGYTCHETCDPHFYGINCSQSCGNCSDNKPCHHKDGRCSNGCGPGYKGNTCHTECDAGFYGHNCSSTCGNCKTNTTCDFIHGQCEQGCNVGFTGGLCVIGAVEDPGPAEPVKGQSNTAAIVASVVIVLLVAALAVIAVVFVIRKKKLQKKPYSTETNEIQFSKISEASDVIPASKQEHFQHSTVNVQHSVTKETEQDQRETKQPNIIKPKIPAKPKIVDDEEDLYMNVNSENQPTSPTMLPIHDLGNYIKIKQQSDEPFQEEYDLLPKDKNGCWDYSGQADLRVKNRYKNIMPYDEYRVILPVIDGDPLTDYINASFIQNYNNERAYIASHGNYGFKYAYINSGPTQATMDDFWRMIWEYKVELVMMLTNLVEQMKIKCDQYWPSGGNLTNGGITVAVQKQELSADYCKRHLLIKKGSEERQLTHYHYTNWPDKGVPSQSSGILALRQIVRNYRDNSTLPVVVHCSAGVGRTGTFIAVDSLLDQAELEGQVDILECVKKLRQQRVNMVQTLIQYKFVYSTIHQATKAGMTQIECCHLQQRLSEMSQVDSSGSSQMQREYEYLDDVKRAINSDTTFVAASAENKNKNRDMNILPDEVSRIILPSSPMTYINAVHVEGFNYKSAFLATQIPLANTAEDFWRLLVDFKCTAIVVLENTDDTMNWFPEPLSHRQVGEFLIQTENETIPSEITMHDLVVQKGEADESEYANVSTAGRIEPRLFLCTSWSPDKSGIATLGNLCSQVQNWVAQSDQKNVAVLCRNGASRTGVFIACSNLANMIKDTQVVNVMEIVKGIRKTRPQFISNMAEYTFLYEIAAAFVAESES